MLNASLDVDLVDRFGQASGPKDRTGPMVVKSTSSKQSTSCLPTRWPFTPRLAARSLARTALKAQAAPSARSPTVAMALLLLLQAEEFGLRSLIRPASSQCSVLSL